MTFRGLPFPTLAAAAALSLAGCGEGPPPAGDTPVGDLWPLTPGSTWTYRVTDELKPVFEKHVQVIGSALVPGTSIQAMQVRDVEPALDEVSWQTDVGGVVARVREEDRFEGSVLRVTTWAPPMAKALSTAPRVGWTYDTAFHETTRFSDGTVIEKDETWSWRVVAMDVTVTTPAGTFEHCVKLERIRTDKVGAKKRTYWLAPGVGKVREEGERTEELVSHHVAR